MILTLKETIYASRLTWKLEMMCHPIARYIGLVLLRTGCCNFLQHPVHLPFAWFHTPLNNHLHLIFGLHILRGLWDIDIQFSFANVQNCMSIRNSASESYHLICLWCDLLWPQSQFDRSKSLIVRFHHVCRWIMPYPILATCHQIATDRCEWLCGYNCAQPQKSCNTRYIL